MKSKIIIAHPLQQHSYKTAEALIENNSLYKYITTIYYKKEKILYKFLSFFLSKDNRDRMERRQNKFFDSYVISIYEFISLIYLLLIRVDKKKMFEPELYNILTFLFSSKVSYICKYIKPDVLIMYDTTAYKAFMKLSSYKTIRVLDMSSAYAMFIRDLIIDEIKSEDSFKKSLFNKLKSYNKSKIEKYKKEIQYTDYFIVPSNFVKKTLTNYGVKEEKIFCVPYGVDIERFKLRNFQKRLNKKLKLLFVGRVEAVKGIFYLLEAVKQLHFLEIELELVGSVEVSKSELSNYETDRIKFSGSKSKTEMPEIYSKNDVLIMPSLWEGFSLTIFEAMASGLPVIASLNSGAEGIIENYVHGFVIEVCSISAIKEKILWFYNNSNQIEIMGKKSRSLAELYTWEKYKENYRRVINEIALIE